MDKRKLTKLIAVCMACLGMGVFTFAGCKDKGTTGGGPTGGEHEIEGGGTGDKEDGDKEGEDDGGKKDEEEEKEKEPVISGPVQGGVEITKASSGELETAYVEWKAAANAKWYNVYYSPEGENAWTKLDAPLVRQYKDYFRADMVGLKAGGYDMKVVPVSADDEEAAEYAATASEISVKAHTREGFAFVNGTASGAYNEDGTLKADAKVIYLTDSNKDTVSLTLNTGKTDETFVGIQPILTAMKKANVPLSVRLIGNVGSTTKDADAANTVLIKENAKGVTFEGIGNDATANGWTLRLVRASNVEVRNLGFMNTRASEPDNITLESDDHVWIHNCDLFYGGAGGDSDQAKGDGALDTKKSNYITHSYNHFWDSGKCNLQNMKEKGAEYNITYHHNWYDHSDSRHPRIRTATVHIYNNYFDGNAKYGVGVTMGASAFVENNYFRSTATMKPMLSSSQGTDGKASKGTFSGENGGIIKSFGNKFDGKYDLIKASATNLNDFDCYEAATRGEQISADYKTKAGNTTYNNFDTASNMYSYTPDTAEQAKVNVERYAGRIDGGDFKWEFDNATEDANYSIITALKNALVAYKGDLVKIDGVTVSSGTPSGGAAEGGEEGGTTGGGVTVTDLDAILFSNGVKDSEGDAISSVTVSGNYNSGSSASTYTFNGETYAKPLKMESATSVKMNFDEAVKLTIYVSVPNKKLKVNGTAKTSDSAGVITVTVDAGECVITKGDQMDLWYILLEPVANS